MLTLRKIPWFHLISWSRSFAGISTPGNQVKSRYFSQCKWSWKSLAGWALKSTNKFLQITCTIYWCSRYFKLNLSIFFETLFFASITHQYYITSFLSHKCALWTFVTNFLQIVFSLAFHMPERNLSIFWLKSFTRRPWILAVGTAILINENFRIRK